ncbi:serine-type D-Ala-D-Ala carboxypeptidase, partial [Providencia rettgeri]
MKNVSSSRNVFLPQIVRQTALASALIVSTVTFANANEAFPNTSVPAAPAIDAEAYILIDYNSGKVLAESNADQRRDPASLTKMMT